MTKSLADLLSALSQFSEYQCFSNPKGINQWTKEGAKQASVDAYEASTNANKNADIASVPAHKHSQQAVAESVADNHAKAAEHHDAAAKEHSKYPDNPEHLEAAERHKTAAAAHREVANNPNAKSNRDDEEQDEWRRSLGGNKTADGGWVYGNSRLPGKDEPFDYMPEKWPQQIGGKV
jgi:hypothetical protein